MPLAVTHRVADVTTVKTPLVVIPMAKGTFPASLAPLDRACEGAIARCWATGDFTGAKDETALLYGVSGPERLLLIGMGDAEQVTAHSLRRAAMIGGKRARVLGSPTAPHHKMHGSVHADDG